MRETCVQVARQLFEYGEIRQRDPFCAAVADLA